MSYTYTIIERTRRRICARVEIAVDIANVDAESYQRSVLGLFASLSVTPKDTNGRISGINKIYSDMIIGSIGVAFNNLTVTPEQTRVLYAYTISIWNTNRHDDTTVFTTYITTPITEGRVHICPLYDAMENKSDPRLIAPLCLTGIRLIPKED